MTGKRVPDAAADQVPTTPLPAEPIPAGTDAPPPSGRGRPVFAPGQIIGERYQVLRFIARGGMGEVYEAEDLTLKGRVALKTIRPDIATDEAVVERFKREINVARRITHPNVSRIYDVGMHREEPQTLFLTMELLAGDTLAARIARGRLTEEEALPLVEQMAAGLGAAHQAGIIHRDFKSANVMLVPRENGFRAVITDFGLARAVASDEGLGTLSEAGLVMGTPAYMAPEQVEGRPLAPAADIYALGIVLYEMVTGIRPFQGDTPLSLAVKRLTQRPEPPRTVVPTLGAAWDATILRCLELQPEARFGTVAEIPAALRSADDSATVIQHPPPSPMRLERRARRLLIGGMVSLVILALAVIFATRREPSAAGGVEASVAEPKISARPALAVLGLYNNSGTSETAWIDTAISEMLTTDLGAGGKLRVIPLDEVARAKADLRLEGAERISTAHLLRLHDSLGIDSAVVGSYTLIGDPGSRLLRIDLRAVDTKTGAPIASTATSGTELQMFDLIARASGGLRQKLGLGELSPAESVEVRASIPSNPEAVRLFTQGLDKLRLLDAAAARDLLVAAARADAEHPLIHSSLSAAYLALGEDANAAEAARRAVALSGNLSREQRLQIEARQHESAKEWGRAIEAGKSLWESFPDDIEYGLDLARAQTSAGRPNEALVTIGALRRLPKPVSSDGRIDLAESRAHQERGDAERQKAFAVSAATKGRTNGSRLLVARARMLEATALITLGDTAGAQTAIDDARDLFREAGDRGGVARALEQTARLVELKGDLEGERKLFEQALALHREIGDRSSIARVLMNIGTVRLHQGRPAEAEQSFEEALDTFRQMNAKYGAAIALNQLGAMLFNRGDLAAAEKRYQESFTLFSDIEEKSGTATALTNIAEVLHCRGRLEEARRLHEDALAINRGIGDKSGIAWDLSRLGEIFAIRGDLVAARARYQEALDLNTEIGDALGAAEVRLAMAILMIEQGAALEGEKIAREAEEILRVEGATDRSLLAQSVVADALLAQGKQKEAQATAARAWTEASKSEDRRLRFSVAVAAARARAASKASSDVDAALQLLESTRAEAVRTQFVTSEMESRLAAAEIELAAGRPGAKTRMQQLRRDAEALGFGRVARRAAAAG